MTISKKVWLTSTGVCIAVLAGAMLIGLEDQAVAATPAPASASSSATSTATSAASVSAQNGEIATSKALEKTAALPAGQSSTAAAQIKRGQYLARAADCAACHTSATGAPFAGGVELASPFGKFYGPNITPDKDHGIGKWTASQFYQVLHDGVSPNRRLYPAMPYTSYRSMTRQDSDDLFAFLMQQKPVAVKNKEADLQFPYSLRFGVRFWNVAFLKDTLPVASQGQSADWQRGRYLVNTLGHCAECHTPRGKLGQMDLSRPFAGGALGRIAATDITPDGLAAVGWTPVDLQTFLKTGIAPQGSAYSEMFTVVHLSTQHLTQGDLVAMSTYLMGDNPPAPQPLKSIKEIKVDMATIDAGKRIYTQMCAACHGREGQGKTHVAVAMMGNSTVRNKDPHNLIASTLDGIEEQDFPGLERMQKMPGFRSKLSDPEMAQLVNFMRASWGGQAADVTAEKIAELRLK
jgi:mono/diheme cytochrome c family protein